MYLCTNQIKFILCQKKKILKKNLKRKHQQKTLKEKRAEKEAKRNDKKKEFNIIFVSKS